MKKGVWLVVVLGMGLGCLLTAGSVLAEDNNPQASANLPIHKGPSIQPVKIEPQMMDDLKKMVEAHPSVAMSLVRVLVSGYGVSGQYDKAIALAKNQLALNPMDVGLKIQVAQLHLDAGHADEALAYIKENKLDDPSNSAASGLLARVYEKMGRHDEAIAVYEKLSEKASDQVNKERYQAMIEKLKKDKAAKDAPKEAAKNEQETADKK